jgi:hypothetical protein
MVHAVADVAGFTPAGTTHFCGVGNTDEVRE